MSEFEDKLDPMADKVAADMNDGRNEGRPRGRRRKKVSFLTLNKIESIDYRDTALLQRFLTERGKIMASRQTGNTAKQQRMVAQAVKKAREMALIPFVVIETSDSGPRRRANFGGEGREGRDRGERAPRDDQD